MQQSQQMECLLRERPMHTRVKAASLQAQCEVIVSIRNPLTISKLRAMNPRDLKSHIERALEQSQNEHPAKPLFVLRTLGVTEHTQVSAATESADDTSPCFAVLGLFATRLILLPRFSPLEKYVAACRKGAVFNL